ncbi:hypothetical protein NQ315_014889, partial [Exocentrus adspersus]
YAVSMATFLKEWNEREVLNYIQNIFVQKLSDVEFEILIPISGNLVKPNIPEGNSLDGSTLCRLTHQKCVYIRPLKDNEVVANVPDSEMRTLQDSEQANRSDSMQLESSIIEQDADNTESFSLIQKSVHDTSIEDDLFETETLIAIKNSTEKSSLGGVDAVQPNLNEIMELNIRREIENIRDAQDLSELQTAVWDSPFMAIAGYTNISAFEKKDKIVENAVKYYLIHRVMPALEQFKEGLNTLRLLDKLRGFIPEFKDLMCSSVSKLTADTLSSLFIVQLSETGSNKRNIEAKILSFWKDYLLDCEEGESEVQLKDILCFATATEQIPPLGFQSSPELQFLHDEEFLWPKANTCAPILYLPVSYKDNEYDKFKSNMDYGILNGMEFGFA